MKETIDLLGKIITNILTALYEPFGFSLLLSFLAMFFYLYAYEPAAAGKGWKSAIVTWYQKFKESVFFRKLFLLFFVTSMILFRTLLNRNLWMNPLSKVMGGWGIWDANSARTVRLFRNRRYIHSDLVVRVFCSKRYVFPLLL